MDAYRRYAHDLLAQGFDEAAVAAGLRTRNLTDDQINQILQEVRGAAPAEVPHPSPPAEAYLDYVKMLATRGMDQAAIASDLLSRGVQPDVIRKLLETATQVQPASYPSSMQQYGTVDVTSTASQAKESTAQPVRMQWGWWLVAILCALPTLLVLTALSGPFTSLSQSLLTIGDITGVLGLCLYVFDLVLSMRLRWTEDLFGGLNKVYVAHAVIGGSALMAILTHPILLSLRYLPDGIHAVAQLFIPSTKYIGTAYGIFAVIVMLVLLFITLYIKLPYRIWLKTHKYLGLAYLLICLHVLFTPNAITHNLFVHAYLLALLALGIYAFTYRTLLPNVFVRHYVYVIKAVTLKTTGVIEVSMTPIEKAMPYTAGQFVFVAFRADGLSPEWHPFTIASAPSSGGVSIDLKSLGAYTETLTRLLPNMVGMSVLLEGAYGRFSFRNFRNLNQVWIAGGIGITPFLSMAQNLGQGPFNIDLYYSVKSESELIDIDKLAQLQVNEPGRIFRVIPFVTDKYNRRLSADLIAQTSGDLRTKDFLICGPPPMMHSLDKQLQDIGVKKYHIHSEEFSIT